MEGNVEIALSISQLFSCGKKGRNEGRVFSIYIDVQIIDNESTRDDWLTSQFPSEARSSCGLVLPVCGALLMEDGM